MTSTATPPAPDSPSTLPRMRQEFGTAPVVTGPAHPGNKRQNRAPSDDSGPRGHLGWIVFGSVATGLVAAVILVAAPFIPVAERAVIGAVLCGFALGWALLALLSVRSTAQPQRWAAAPALFMGLGVFSC